MTEMRLTVPESKGPNQGGQGPGPSRIHGEEPPCLLRPLVLAGCAPSEGSREQSLLGLSRSL